LSILRTYLEACYNSLLQNFDRTTAAGNHGGDLGENRENLIVDFINQNQPRRLYAHRGGQVIGINSEPSQQIDILVTHDSSIEFREDSKSYRVAEAILAGIAVKSNLTREHLKSDFKNLASIPKPSHVALKLAHSDAAGLLNIYSRTYPIRMLIGWDGATSDSLMSALNEVVSENPDIPVDNYPDVITVLKRGFSLQLHGKKEFLKGEISREQIGWRVVPEKDGAAWPLVWILNQLSAGSGWAAMFTVSLEPYWSITN
jgi:hypothetical protein